MQTSVNCAPLPRQKPFRFNYLEIIGSILDIKLACLETVFTVEEHEWIWFICCWYPSWQIHAFNSSFSNVMQTAHVQPHPRWKPGCPTHLWRYDARYFCHVHEQSPRLAIFVVLCINFSYYHVVIDAWYLLLVWRPNDSVMNPGSSQILQAGPWLLTGNMCVPEM